MTIAGLAPPLTPLKQIDQALRNDGFAVVSAETVAEFSHIALSKLQGLTQFWQNLPRDPYLKDGGRYRYRRHASYIVRDSSLEMAPHRAHWQSLDYNALHGGIERWFEPLQPELAQNQHWQQLIIKIAQLLSAIAPSPAWFVEVHPFRIDTSDGIGRPTPEGAHRDGVDFVAVILVDRVGVKGGETRIFESQGSIGLRFTLQDSWSALLLNDAKMIHETTPIQPTAAHGYRDTLVITFRRNGFQEPPRGQDQ